MPLYGAIATVAVIVVVIVGLGFENVIPGFHLGASGGGGSGGVGIPHPTTYRVTFEQSGLPASTSWSVVVQGTSHGSTGSSVTLQEPNGTYGYSVGPITGYTAAPASGTMIVSGAAVSQSIDFTPIAPPTPATYSVTFSESGLPPGTNWSVALHGVSNHSTGRSITFIEGNGTYAYSVASVVGYTSDPSSGSLTVNGAASTVAVEFTVIPPASYSVSFGETGLPPGTDWSVTIQGVSHNSTTAAIHFTEPNGTYSYAIGIVVGYTASASGGTESVHGAAVSVSVAFSATVVPPPTNGTYPVTFDQSGLPSSVPWSVLLVLGAPPHTYASPTFGERGEGGSMAFSIPNETYTWSVASTYTNYSVTPSGGSLTVAGTAITVAITFALSAPTSMLYAVAFSEKGLPARESWFAALNGTVQAGAAGGAISFSVPNGSYYYNVSASAPGYLGSPDSGYVIVVGTAVDLAITFAPAYLVTFTETGLPLSGYWEVAINGSYNSVSIPGNVTFQLANGSYPFAAGAPGYAASPSGGTLRVNGSALTIPITFAAVRSNIVNFTEVGLPAGIPWTVEIGLDGSGISNGTVSRSDGANVSAPDGNYTWVVQALAAGYYATPSTGGILLHGADLHIGVVFATTPSGDVQVLFEEGDLLMTGTNGVPNRTSWYVTMGASNQRTTGMYLLFLVPNGTYVYTIIPPAGYTALPSSGTITVNASSSFGFFGPAAEVIVAFVPGVPSPPPLGGVLALPAIAGEPPTHTTAAPTIPIARPIQG